MAKKATPKSGKTKPAEAAAKQPASGQPESGAAAPGGAAAGASQQQAGGAPTLNVLAQYTKDLSFESPNAPQSLTGGKAPNINININVNAKPIAETDFEVELSLEVKASQESNLVFNIELVYGGVFRLLNIPQDNIQPILLIECPRILFPFARQIVATASRDGGFPPLMVDPIDFAALYRQRAAGQAQAN